MTPNEDNKMNGKDNGKMENAATANSSASSTSASAASANAVSAAVEDLQSQVEKYKNDYLYLRAEFETFRRNAIKERSDALKYGSERLFLELLNVLDNFDRALSTKLTPDNLSVFSKGIEMTAQELKAAINKFGLTEVPCQPGTPFDPTIHEAVSSEPSKSEPAGAVTRVLRKPYKLFDRVIRPAQVVVAAPAEKQGD